MQDPTQGRQPRRVRERRGQRPEPESCDRDQAGGLRGSQRDGGESLSSRRGRAGGESVTIWSFLHLVLELVGNARMVSSLQCADRETPGSGVVGGIDTGARMAKQREGLGSGRHDSWSMVCGAVSAPRQASSSKAPSSLGDVTVGFG